MLRRDYSGENPCLNSFHEVAQDRLSESCARAKLLRILKGVSANACTCQIRHDAQSGNVLQFVCVPS